MADASLSAPGRDESGAADGGPDRVRRRRVFYVSGFDPQGPAHYHRLYVDEAARQAAVLGCRIDVGRRERVSAESSGWAVHARWPSAAAAGGGQGDPGDEAVVDTFVEFLRWDDIVRAHWPRSRWRVMASTLATTWAQLRNGVLPLILRTSWPAFLVLFMPPALVVGLLLGALGLGVAGAALAAHGHPAIGAAVVLAGGWGWWRFAAWAEARVQMAWLMRSTRFILRQAAGRTPELEARIDAFAEQVRRALAENDVDEVLVVGHSSGAMLAASVVARVAGAGATPAAWRGRLALLTLGECIPMLSYQPEAEAFRHELAALARSGVPWVDVTAPPDGCCFALVDPTAVARRRLGQDGAPGWQGPRRLNARFAQAFDPEVYAAVRRDKYRCHFQYLMATGRPAAYDYFSVTAGPVSLAARFAAQRSVDDFRQFQVLGGPGW